MKCYQCEGITTVCDSRVTSDGRYRRRRICLTCNTRFTTFEIRREASQEMVLIDKVRRLKRDLLNTVRSFG